MGLFSDLDDQVTQKLNSQSAGAGNTSATGGASSYEQQIVRKLAEGHGRKDVAKAWFPTTFASMYGGQPDTEEPPTTEQSTPNDTTPTTPATYTPSAYERRMVQNLVESNGRKDVAKARFPAAFAAMYGEQPDTDEAPKPTQNTSNQNTQSAYTPSAYERRMVQHLVEGNGRRDVAKAKFPAAFASMYNEEDASAPETDGTTSVFDASTGEYKVINIGKKAATYKDDGFDLNKVSFDTSALERTDADKDWAETLRVDYSKLGELNGGRSHNAYNMYSNTDLLPVLFAYRLGLRPAEVNALDLHTRREVATKLLSDYYDKTNDELRSRIGGKDNWIKSTLRAYGMEDNDTNNGYDDKDWLDHIGAIGKSVVRGAGEAVSNYEAAATALIGDGKYQDKDLGKDLAGYLQAADEASKTDTGRYLQQRLEQLMREGRYMDAAYHIVTHGDLLAAYAGPLLGSAVMDGIVTKAIIQTGGAIAAPFTGGASTVAASSANIASTAASLAGKLEKLGTLAKLGVLGGVSSANMVGGVAKEILLKGNEIPSGSDVHKELVKYGLIGMAISGLPGTVEQQIFDRIMKSTAGKALTEQAGRATAKSIRESLEQAGYKFTADGVVKPFSRKAIDWGVKPAAKGAVEGTSEYVQEYLGSRITQGAQQDGSFDVTKIDEAQAHEAGKLGALLGFGVASTGGGLSQIANSSQQSKQLRAYESLRQAEEVDKRAFETFVSENTERANEIMTDAWRYNEDGSLKTAEEQEAIAPEVVEAYMKGDPNDLSYEQRKHAADVATAVLRKEFDAQRQAEHQNATSRTPDEDISMTDFKVPEDIVVDTDVAQQIRDEYTRRNAILEANIRRTNVGDLYVAPDVMKDVANVTDTDRKALDRILNSVKAQVDKGRKAIEKEQARIDEKYKVPLPEQVKASEVGQRILAEEQQARAELAALRARIDEMDLAHANSHSAEGVVDLLAKAEAGDWVPNQRSNVVRLGAIMADAVANAGYEPGSKHSRFNRSERQTVVDELVSLAGVPPESQMARVIQLHSGDLSTALSFVRTALRSDPYAGGKDVTRRLAQLDMLETIVEKDMPEMLGNWQVNKDKKTKGIKAVHDGWDGNDVAYSNTVDAISRTLGWGKYRNTDGNPTLARSDATAAVWSSLVKDGKLRTNPIAALQELYDSLVLERDSISLRDGASLDETRAFNERNEVINGLLSQVAGYQYAINTGKPVLPLKVIPNSNKAGTGFTHRDMAAVPAQLRTRTGDYLERIANKLGYDGFGKDVYYADPQRYLAYFKQRVTSEPAFGAEIQSKSVRRKNPLLAGLESPHGADIEARIREEMPAYLDKVSNMISEYNTNAHNKDFVFEDGWDGQLTSDAEVENYIYGAEAVRESLSRADEARQQGKQRVDEADETAREVMEATIPINPPVEPQPSTGAPFKLSEVTKPINPFVAKSEKPTTVYGRMVESLVGGTRVVNNMRIVTYDSVRAMLDQATEQSLKLSVDVPTYFRDFVTATKTANPDDVVLHRTLDVLADKFDQQEKVDQFLANEKNQTKRQAKLNKETLVDVNNRIFHRMLESAGVIEAADIKGLMDLVATSETHAGYKAFYAQLNETAVANNVAIEYVKTDHPSGQDVAAMWFPSENKIRVYGSKSQKDVATSLLHEYMHVAFSNRGLNGVPLPIFSDLEANIQDPTSPVYAAKVRVERLATKNPSLRDNLQISGVLDSEGKVSVDGMEEFIVTYMTDPAHRDLVNSDKRISDLFDYIMREAAKAQNPSTDSTGRIPDTWKLVRETAFGTGNLAYENNAKARTRQSHRVDPLTGDRIRPNESNPKDRTTAVTFSFAEDNPNVTSLATAWYNAGGGWSFFYYDRDGVSHQIDGLDYAGVMKSAQDLDLWIDQVQKDVLLSAPPTRANEYYDRNAAGTRKLLQVINRATGGNDNKISAPVRWLTRTFQDVAVNQSGIDHFFAFYENALYNTTGKDKRGKIQTEINRIRSETTALFRPGVGGRKSVYDFKNDLIRYMKSTGWTEAKINKTMYAMMAGRRHYEIMTRQKTDPRWRDKPLDLNANVSGFKLDDGTSDPTGEKYLATLSTEERRTADELAKLVTALNDSVLDYELQSGRISQNQYAQMRGQFYVPLRNDTDEATAFQRMATGRHTYADDPLTHLLANHEARIVAAERSRIYQTFMDMVEADPIPGFVTFNSSTLKKNGEGEYAMTADGFIEGNSVTFYRDGKKVRMTVVDPVVAKAMKKAGERATSAYFDTLSKITGYMGLVRTSDPVFAKTAFFRDVSMVFTNIQAAFRGKEDFSDLEWAALSAATIRDMVRYAPLMIKGRYNQDTADFRYKVYRTQGGIGNKSAFSIDAVQKALEVDVFAPTSTKSRLKRAANTYLDVLHVSDDAARFSLWLNYLETKHGGKFANEADLVKYLHDNPEIADRARDGSKNITGNFEQRGLSRSVRSHVVFWNAIMAGLRNVYGMLNPRYGTYGLKSLGFLFAYILASGSDEEDEDGKLREPRAKNLGNVITIGGKDYPIAPELRGVVHLAQAFKYGVFRDDWSTEQTIRHVSNGILQSVGMFTPAQTDDTLTNAIYALTPTLIQPAVLQISGKTYFGSDPAPAPYDSAGRQWTDAPDYLRATTGTSDISVGLAEKLYKLTSGNVDVAPNNIDMWIQHALGSIWSRYRAVDKSMAEGASLPEAFAGLFTKDHEHVYNVYALRDEWETRIKAAKQSLRLPESGSIIDDEKSLPPEYHRLKALEKALNKELERTGDETGAVLSDLYRQLHVVKANDSPSPDEIARITHQIEQVTNNRNVVYGKYLKQLSKWGY